MTNTAGHGLHEKYKNSSIDQWHNAMLDAAANKDPAFPKFTHIPRLGSADLKSGIDEAFKLYRIARPHIEACLGADKTYLDFGCGVGRILKTFMRDFAPENMIGLDVTAEFIDMLKVDFGSKFTFHHIQTRPPCMIPDNSVDVITAYSVFSHFSGIQATRWLDEFHRITRPGATLILTTYGRGHVKYVCDTPLEQVPPNHVLQRNDIMDAGGKDEFFRMFAMGEMLYYVRHAVFGAYDYGQAYVGEEFARRVWGRNFEVVEVIDDYQRLEQMAVVLRKRK
ncbi:MAG: class I SAM-dependent methyltransferase [Paracoccaceae bacterium]